MSARVVRRWNCRFTADYTELRRKKMMLKKIVVNKYNEPSGGFSLSPAEHPSHGTGTISHSHTHSDESSPRTHHSTVTAQAG